MMVCETVVESTYNTTMATRWSSAVKEVGAQCHWQLATVALGCVDDDGVTKKSKNGKFQFGLSLQFTGKYPYLGNWGDPDAYNNVGRLRVASVPKTALHFSISTQIALCKGQTNRGPDRQEMPV